MATIYKIEFDEYIYIGSTKDMKQRQSRHNYVLNGNTDRSHFRLYTTAREKGINCFELITIEECSIDDRFNREQHYIDVNNTDKLLNCVNAIFDKKEYMEEYREKNKERIKEYRKEYYHKKKQAELNDI